MAIIFCRSAFDVSNAICWCIENSVPFRVRAGRHNYEGYSTGNSVLVIDISRINTLEIDEDAMVLTVGGGVRNEDFYNFISSKGYPFPGGSCPSVGISGYTLGGGWGYSARYLGLGCDSLIEVELIDYNGKKIIANKTLNPDLFWALQGGGGGNFGVVVLMKFRLPKRVDRVTFIQLYYPNTSAEQQVKFLNIWQNWLIELDDRMTLGARIFNSESEGRAVFSRGIFYGNPTEAEFLIKPLLSIKGVQVNLQYLPFLNVIKQIESSYSAYEKFKSVSGFAQRKYSISELYRLVDTVENRAKGSIYAGISLYSMGGRITSKKSSDTAFFYRNTRYIVWLNTVWEEDIYKNQNMNWIDERAGFIGCITRGSYINFPYSGLYNYMDEYYGFNKYRLIDVKCKYDPCNVFRFPQSIR